MSHFSHDITLYSLKVHGNSCFPRFQIITEVYIYIHCAYIYILYVYLPRPQTIRTKVLWLYILSYPKYTRIRRAWRARNSRRPSTTLWSVENSGRFTRKNIGSGQTSRSVPNVYSWFCLNLFGCNATNQQQVNLGMLNKQHTVSFGMFLSLAL